jgi:hypothetical protein
MLKIGQNVTIRRDLSTLDRTSYSGITIDMLQYAGRVTKISDIFKGRPICYYLDGCQDWVWSEEMLILGDRKIKTYGIVKFCKEWTK